MCQAENWAFTPSREAAPGRDQSGERLARETILTGPILRAMSVRANGERMRKMSQTWLWPLTGLKERETRVTVCAAGGVEMREEKL